MSTKNLKPFDLEAALKGEPVMLRDGQKAFVRHHETELLVDYSTKMFGYTVRDGGSSFLSSWDVDGRCFGKHLAHLDIIGMYPKTRIINGFEVPAPETAKPDYGTRYFSSSLSYMDMAVFHEWNDDDFDTRMLKRGIVFLSAEDAIANAKAMLGIDPYEDGKE